MDVNLMAKLQSTPTYSANFTQRSSSVNGSSVFERFEGPASVKGSLSTMVSSSNKQPKDNNLLHCDAVTEQVHYTRHINYIA